MNIFRKEYFKFKIQFERKFSQFESKIHEFDSLCFLLLQDSRDLHNEERERILLNEWKLRNAMTFFEDTEKDSKFKNISLFNRKIFF